MQDNTSDNTTPGYPSPSRPVDAVFESSSETAERFHVLGFRGHSRIGENRTQQSPTKR